MRDYLMLHVREQKSNTGVHADEKRPLIFESASNPELNVST
jgi:hypothetical protein